MNHPSIIIGFWVIDKTNNDKTLLSFYVNDISKPP